ncbi:GNAT family N-acetyltransferase [Longispora albida]|uniref:GNAT family N-acetyltransferase n=1 Tax=Longispora albida TaxID=203523 RepID=UPI000360AEA4|nr:GNAT family N-acetyltransferase [Longispora albida]
MLTVRGVRADEWAAARAFRLDALRDPIAAIAFLDTYDNALTRPDEQWRDRTARAAAGETMTQCVAVDEDGTWAGVVTAFVERAGDEETFGDTPKVDQAHIVGVYVRPDHRGTGLAGELFAAALAWAFGLAEPRVEQVRLFVHEHNTRAQGLYAKMGFRLTGATVPFEGDPEQSELEMAVPRPAGLD